MVFGVESKCLRHLPPADLPLFNVKLVLVSGRVPGPSQEQQGKIFFYPFVHRARCLHSKTWWTFHRLSGKVTLCFFSLEGTVACSSDLSTTMSLCRLCLPPHLFVSHLSISLCTLLHYHNSSCKTEIVNCAQSTHKRKKVM